jgi:glycine/D-amino acid oxidase-like deaminating enzyme
VVGLRPVRSSGYRVEAERFGEKVVIHNYGHGARGVGMSWGTAHRAVEHGQQTAETRFAVIGCGAVGLATARLLQQRGFEVTIYAKDLPPNTTSNAAGAMFDVAPEPGDDEFAREARLSHRYFLDLVGDRYGVRWLESYRFDSEGYRRERERNLIKDLYEYRIVAPEEHPFGPLEMVREVSLQIQTPVYLEAMMQDFREAGGRIARRDFPDLGSLLDLPERVIMNCTGIGARALFGDDELVPYKGQYTIMLPEPDMDYAAGWVTPRDDGLLVGGATVEPGVSTLEANEEEMRRRLDRSIEFWERVRES